MLTREKIWEMEDILDEEFPYPEKQYGKMKMEYLQSYFPERWENMLEKEGLEGTKKYLLRMEEDFRSYRRNLYRQNITENPEVRAIQDPLAKAQQINQLKEQIREQVNEAIAPMD